MSPWTYSWKGWYYLVSIGDQPLGDVRSEGHNWYWRKFNEEWSTESVGTRDTASQRLVQRTETA